MTEDNQFFSSIREFIKQYAEMDINGVIFHCPYWMNKLKDGKVTMRGFANGKGRASEIREELIKRINDLSPELKFELTPENLRKFAKRERIGIDCSGFAYRLLDELVRLNYRDCVGLNNLESVFAGGINKTNARTLTSLDFCNEVSTVKNIIPGDIVRLWGGKHIVIIIKIDDKKITYAHSSSLSTQIQGVHTSIIHITDSEKSLAEQNWEEKTRVGENFGKKHFNPQNGDGVFRLKIFH